MTHSWLWKKSTVNPRTKVGVMLCLVVQHISAREKVPVAAISSESHPHKFHVYIRTVQPGSSCPSHFCLGMRCWPGLGTWPLKPANPRTTQGPLGRALFLPWPLCASISLQCVLLSVAWNSGGSVSPLQMQKYLCSRVPHKDKWKFYLIVKALWGVLFAWHLRNSGGDPGLPLAPSLFPTPF